MKGIILRRLPWHLRGLISFRISGNLHAVESIETDDKPGLLKHPRIFMLDAETNCRGSGVGILLAKTSCERFRKGSTED